MKSCFPRIFPSEVAIGSAWTLYTRSTCFEPSDSQTFNPRTSKGGGGGQMDPPSPIGFSDLIFEAFQAIKIKLLVPPPVNLL